MNSSYSKHLVIYPKVCKANRRRNLHKLKVSIAPSASSFLLASQQKQTVEGSHKNLSNYDQSHSLHGKETSKSPIITQNDIIADKVCKMDTSLDDKCDFHGNTYLTHDSLHFLETLGTGNSAVVRSAIHKQSKTVTAVKSITLDLSGEEKKQILLELEILRRYNTMFDSRIFTCLLSVVYFLKQSKKNLFKIVIYRNMLLIYLFT